MGTVLSQNRYPLKLLGTVSVCLSVCVPLTGLCHQICAQLVRKDLRVLGVDRLLRCADTGALKDSFRIVPATAKSKRVLTTVESLPEYGGTRLQTSAKVLIGFEDKDRPSHLISTVGSSKSEFNDFRSLCCHE
jgi:hypothetical protein